MMLPSFSWSRFFVVAALVAAAIFILLSETLQSVEVRSDIVVSVSDSRLVAQSEAITHTIAALTTTDAFAESMQKENSIFATTPVETHFADERALFFTLSTRHDNRETAKEALLASKRVLESMTETLYGKESIRLQSLGAVSYRSVTPMLWIFPIALVLGIVLAFGLELWFARRRGIVLDASRSRIPSASPIGSAGRWEANGKFSRVDPSRERSEYDALLEQQTILETPYFEQYGGEEIPMPLHEELFYETPKAVNNSIEFFPGETQEEVKAQETQKETPSPLSENIIASSKEMTIEEKVVPHAEAPSFIHAPEIHRVSQTHIAPQNLPVANEIPDYLKDLLGQPTINNEQGAVGEKLMGGPPSVGEGARGWVADAQLENNLEENSFDAPRLRPTTDGQASASMTRHLPLAGEEVSKEPTEAEMKEKLNRLLRGEL